MHSVPVRKGTRGDDQPSTAGSRGVYDMISLLCWQYVQLIPKWCSCCSCQHVQMNPKWPTVQLCSGYSCIQAPAVERHSLLLA